MMRGQHTADGQNGNLFEGIKIIFGIRRWKISKKHTMIDEITRKKISFFFLPKAHMSRRMAGRMKNRYLTAAKIDRFSVPQYACRLALKKRITLYTKTFWQFAVGNIFFNQRKRQRKAFCKPFDFRFMNADIGKISVSPDMIPMNMRCRNDDRIFSQFFNL